MSTPCKGCENRVIGCHASCESYKNWQEWNEELKRRIRKQKGLVQELDNRKIVAIKKMRKSK